MVAPQGKLDNEVFFWVQGRVSILSVKKQRMGWSFPPKAVFSGIRSTDKIAPQKGLPSRNTLLINPVLFVSYKTPQS